MSLICENKCLGCPADPFSQGLQDMMHAFTMKAGSTCQALSWQVSGFWTLAKILLGPGSPGCHMAAPGHGSAHSQAGASCSGEGWKGGKGKYFTWCTAPSSADNSGFEYLHILAAESSAEDNPGKSQHSDGKVCKQEPNLDVLAQL